MLDDFSLVLTSKKSYRRYLAGGGGYCLSANYFSQAPFCELEKLARELRALCNSVSLRNGNVFCVFEAPFDEPRIAEADAVMRKWVGR